MMPEEREAMPPLRYELAARAEAAVRGAGPWSLQHLRVPWIVVGAAALPVALLAWVLSGVASAVAVVVAVLVVGFFFSVSAWTVAKAGAVDPRHTMPAALLTYGIKLGLLALFFAVYPTQGEVDRRWLGATVAVGALFWISAHAVTVWRTPLLYVDLSAAENPSDQGELGSPRAVVQ
jgi:hypothetical protein